MNNEPVAWIYKRNDGVKFLNWKTWKDCETCNGEFIPLYTAPRELSDEEIWKLADMVLENSDVIGFARAILKKASEK